MSDPTEPRDDSGGSPPFDLIVSNLRWHLELVQSQPSDPPGRELLRLIDGVLQALEALEQQGK